jgi:hypothetical protein
MDFPYGTAAEILEVLESRRRYTEELRVLRA